MWAPTSAKDTTEKPRLPVLMRLLCNRAAQHATLAHAASSCHLPLQGASVHLAQRTDSLHTTPCEVGGGDVVVRVGTLGATVSTDRDGERVRKGHARVESMHVSWRPGGGWAGSASPSLASMSPTCSGEPRKKRAAARPRPPVHAVTSVERFPTPPPPKLEKR